MTATPQVRKAQQQLFPRTPKSVSEARAWVHKCYSALEFDPWAAEQLISELATNAVLHACGDTYTVRVQPCGRIEVHDRSPLLPERRHAAEDEMGGRGLLLVEALALESEVVVNDDRTGKRFVVLPMR